jgi:tetratricopeptide (TPR) repeat protein
MSEANRADRRLDSWKEIAVFFGRDERTVRRWEKERALPVHRVPGKGRGSVYAFEDELTQWLKSPNYSEESISPDVQTDGSASEPVPADETQNNGLRNGAEGQQQEISGSASAFEKSGQFRRNLMYLVAALVLLLVVGVIAATRFPSSWISSLLPKTLSTKLGLNSASHSNSTKKSASANPEAQELYLKGRYEWSRRSPESLNRAVDLFTQAIVRDPTYAPAYAGLADTYNLLREYTSMPSSEAYPRAIAAAKKAVELDDTLSDAHRSLAFASFYWNWDFAGGEKDFKRAIELNPSDPVAHHWYGTALAVLSRFDESLAELERARQLDPTSASIVADKGIILFDAHKITDAVAILKQVEATDPNFISPHVYLAVISLYNKDYPSYLAESKKAAELRHDQPALEIAVAAKKAFDSGNGQAMLMSIYHTQKKDYSQGLIIGLPIAETCALLGKNDEALQYLREDYKRHDPNIMDIAADPFFADMANDHAFRELVTQIGLPQK